MEKKDPPQMVRETCERCGWNWVPRVPDPVKCPRCFRPLVKAS